MIEKLLKEFVEFADDAKLPLEGIAAGDEEKVIFEYHFVPDLPRNIYSHTKSFMSTAVGIAMSEGKISLDDRLVDAFAQKISEGASERLQEIKLRHLLTMSSGFGRPYLMSADRRSGVGGPDYLSYMLSQEVLEKPGSRFEYSTGDSILAGRMVEQATGVRISQYLFEHILRPLEIGFPIWENDMQGHPNSGGGMFLKLTDMMKLGQLYLGGGVWKGQRLVEKEWIKTAISVHIETPVSEEKEDVWRCGYGYQFWMSPYKNSYRADGAYGQITTVLPEAGYVVSVQCPERGNFERVKQELHRRVLAQL